MKKIYMDYAATSPMDKRVFAAMKPYFSKKLGNASSLHSFGQEAKKAMDSSRDMIAKFLGAEAKEIIFTSGGTESNNFAFKGIAFASKKKHIVTTKIEHSCIMNLCKWLETQGFDVTYLPVDSHGLVDPENVRKAIRKDTALVSVMAANNEIGTIEPINEIGKICRERGVLFHTDAVQAFGSIKIDIKNVDLLTASAHKLYGPKGVGLLYVRRGVKLTPLIHGGGQEFGLRGSTENVPGIVGFAKAVEIAKKEMIKEARRLSAMRNKLIKNTLKIENSCLNGHPKKRLPNNAHFAFKFIEGEALIMMLDEKGVSASTGSACSSKSLEPSHVLLAIGLKHEEAHGSLRLTLGRHSKNSDVKYVSKILPSIVKDLRKMSPFKENYDFFPTKGFEEDH